MKLKDLKVIDIIQMPNSYKDYGWKSLCSIQKRSH